MPMPNSAPNFHERVMLLTTLLVISYRKRPGENFAAPVSSRSSSNILEYRASQEDARRMPVGANGRRQPAGGHSARASAMCHQPADTGLFQEQAAPDFTPSRCPRMVCST